MHAKIKVTGIQCDLVISYGAENHDSCLGENSSSIIIINQLLRFVSDGGGGKCQVFFAHEKKAPGQPCCCQRCE